MPPCCVWWEYKDHPNHNAILLDAFAAEQSAALANHERWRIPGDTRPTHRACFEPLTLKGLEYYAGNSRGSAIGCLVHFKVGVGGDDLVGDDPAEVAGAMARIEGEFLPLITAVEQLDGAVRVQHAIALAAEFLTYFLTVHPYINGNGHTARFGAWVLMRHLGLDPAGFIVHGTDLPYGTALYQHRRGNVVPLEQFLYSCLA